MTCSPLLCASRCEEVVVCSGFRICVPRMTVLAVPLHFSSSLIVYYLCLVCLLLVICG